MIPRLSDRGLAVEVVALRGGGRELQALKNSGVKATELGLGGWSSFAALPRVRRIQGRDTQAIVSWAPNAHAVGALAARIGRSAHVINWHRQPGFPLTNRQKAALQLAARAGAGAIAVTASQTSDLEGFGMPRSRIRVVPNGTEAPMLHTDPRRVREEFGIPDGAFLACMVARFRSEKRQADLVEAAARLNRRGHNFHVIFVGDGPELETLRSGAASARGNVHFAGYSEDPSRFMQAADLVCLTSSHEALPMSLIEANASGKPSVATDVGGTAEIVRDGETGFLYQPGAIDDLTDRIEKFLEDPKLSEEMGSRALALWRDRYSFDGMVDAYYRLLTGVSGPPLTWNDA